MSVDPVTGDPVGVGRAVAAPPRGLVALTVAAGLVLLVLAAVLVPWTPAPPVVDPSAGLPADEVRRAEQVAAALRLPSLLSTAAGLLGAAAVVLSRPGRRLLARARRVPGGRAAEVAAQVLVVLLVVLVVRWPFGVWAEVVRRQEGLSVRGWDVFVRDRLVAAGLDAVVLVPAVVVVVLLAARLPRWWPAAVAGLGAGLVVALSLLYPVVVEPLFARSAPLVDGPVRSQVEALADRAGAPVSDVVVAETSARATTLNASVSGLGPTRRVVLQDTLLEAMTPPQALAVVAHETAHAASRDVVRGTVLGAAGVAAAVLVTGCVALARPRGRRVGLSRAAGPVLLVVLAAQVVLVPAEALVSRQVERAADARALELTADPASFAEAMRVLAVTNRADPSPPAWVQWWFGSHPTLAERVAVAERLQP